MPSTFLLFFDVSGGEFLVIMVGIFLVFGPKKMPEIARKIGRTMNELKKASSDITKEFRDETNSIKNELVAARESIRRETDVIKKDIDETRIKVEKNLSTENLEKTQPADDDPYGLKNRETSKTTESAAETNTDYTI